MIRVVSSRVCCAHVRSARRNVSSRHRPWSGRQGDDARERGCSDAGRQGREGGASDRPGSTRSLGTTRPYGTGHAPSREDRQKGKGNGTATTERNGHRPCTEFRYSDMAFPLSVLTGHTCLNARKDRRTEGTEAQARATTGRKGQGNSEGVAGVTTALYHVSIHKQYDRQKGSEKKRKGTEETRGKGKAGSQGGKERTSAPCTHSNRKPNGISN